jgi:hypothetical protein
MNIFAIFLLHFFVLKKKKKKNVEEVFSFWLKMAPLTLSE